MKPTKLQGLDFFSEETRRAVADGPLFDTKAAVIANRPMLINSRRECVVLALCRLQPVPLNGRPVGLNYTLRTLSHRNDRGHYAGPTGRLNLYADLLGEELQP